MDLKKKKKTYFYFMDLKKKTYFYFMDLESLRLEIHKIKIQDLSRAQNEFG